MGNWRLYAKHVDEKRFKPVDWKNGTTVTNLLYATIFNDEEKLRVQPDLDNAANEEFNFEWRRV
jgi:hypothetical protein